MNASSRLLFPLAIIFFLTNIAVFLLGPLLKSLLIEPGILLGANVLFFLLSLLSFFIQQKGLQNKNPHVFVRSVMTGMLIKMVICIIAVIGYVYFSGDNFNKRGIFLALFLYLVYLPVEVFAVMKLNKKSNA